MSERRVPAFQMSLRVGRVIVLLSAVMSGAVFDAHTQGPADCVDPIIGTANGGNTFPGAVRPWGMTSVSPHNAPGAPSGYIAGESRCSGFGMVHLSGTGCADLGSIVFTPVRTVDLSHGGLTSCILGPERASPGYYAVELVDPCALVEATVGRHSAMLRLTPRDSTPFSVVLNLGQSLALTGGGALHQVSSRDIEGYNIAGGFCGESNRERVYCAVRFSADPSGSGLWAGSTIRAGTSLALSDTALGCWLTFDRPLDRPLLIKVGISYTSVENARRNLREEIPGWDFDGLHGEARNEWNDVLQRIGVEGGSRTDSVRFYTALYHCLIHPNIISDRSGDYPAMGGGVRNSPDDERYSVYSLWDTYRTLHPLLTLVYPERQSAMIRSMLGMYREHGWLPKWELAGRETYMMSGDPAVPMLADAYVKGIRDFDAELALEAMLRPSAMTTERSAPPIRAGYHELLRHHYIPFEQDTLQEWWVWGPASTTLEYCLADWATGSMARVMGRDSIARVLQTRSLWYRNLFDQGTRFIRPRRSSGEWLSPFDPFALEGSGSWVGSGGPGYVEGNAWQYAWFVPHDIPGLIDLFGGRSAFAAKLDSCFALGQFTINNEPDIAYPYLYTYIPGVEYKTGMRVREIRDVAFGAGPGGLPGNDDCGTLSAWFVFSALGIYPDCPGSPEYRIGVPLFQEATIRLNRKYYPGGSLVISAGTQRRNPKAASAMRFNNTPLKGFRISHMELTGGGVLSF
jgi:predicted alpha-1,2-mannosidase